MRFFPVKAQGDWAIWDTKYDGHVLTTDDKVALFARKRDVKRVIGILNKKDEEE